MRCTGAFGSRRRLAVAPTQSQTTFYAQDPWLSLPWALLKLGGEFLKVSRRRGDPSTTHVWVREIRHACQKSPRKRGTRKVHSYFPTSEPSALPGTFLARMPDLSDPHMGPPFSWSPSETLPRVSAVPTALVARAVPSARCRPAGLQPSFHPRSNRSPPCGRGRVAASTQRSYVGRRPGPRRPRSAVRRACARAAASGRCGACGEWVSLGGRAR